MRRMLHSAMKRGGGSNGKKCSIRFAKVMVVKGMERMERCGRSPLEALLRGGGGRPDVDIFTPSGGN